MEASVNIKLTQKEFLQYKQEAICTAIVVLIGLFLFYRHMPMTHLAMVLLFFIFILFDFPSKIPFVISILLLVGAMLVSGIHQAGFARPFAIYAYYFFIIGVAAEIAVFIKKELYNFIHLKRSQYVMKQLFDYFSRA